MVRKDPARTPLLNQGEPEDAASYTKRSVGLAPDVVTSAAEDEIEFNETGVEISVFLNAPEKNTGFASNVISTARYNVITFIPLNLFSQFRRIANIYFLLVVAVQFIPEVSPFSVWISALPLFFIVAVTCIKDGFEDYYRHQEDKKNNNIRVYRLDCVNEKDFIKDKARNLVVGDIIRIGRHCEVPADCIVIGCSNPDGTCYINTASLDGENAPKERRVVPQISKLSTTELCEATGETRFAPNTQHLEGFVGTLYLNNTDEPIPLGDKNFYYRGSFVSNVDHMIALVLFTGADTTMMLNRKPQPFKFSTFESTINNAVLGLLFAHFIICCGLTLLGQFYDVPYLYVDPYNDNDLDSAHHSFIVFWMWYVIFSYMVPISLYVTVEFVKLYQAVYINCDEDMMVYADQQDDEADEVELDEDEEPEEVQTKLFARVKNSALNEELGMVRYIFTDKTGTLTQNKMELSKCSVCGRRFQNDVIDTHQNQDDEPLSNLVKLYVREAIDEKMAHFFHAMLLNNDCIITNDKTDERGFPNSKSYSSPSPDEVAFVQALSAHGIAFINRFHGPESIQFNFRRSENVLVTRKFMLLGQLDFTADRKRMSVIVQDNETGRYFIYVKGADSKILTMCTNSSYTQDTENHIREFAIEGCRTLAFAYRELTKAEFENFQKLYDEANRVIQNREEMIERAFLKFESDLELLGATAVNDQLQSGVPWSISKLKEAGIVITVLTGDKEETAITIAKEAKLLTCPNVHIIRHDRRLEYDVQVNRIVEEITQLHMKLMEGPWALVISGNALEIAVEHTNFIPLIRMLDAIVCYRANPTQKMLVVQGAKMELETCSLAIGDGANDVSMIQEAHVGVGIQGREGSQAALSADFVLYRFRHLTRLILTHGRYAYLRTSKTVIMSFYKNIAFILPCAYFAFYSLSSTQNLYEGFTMTCFNITFSALTPLAIGFFEEDIPQDATIAHPLAYRQFTRNPLFTLSYFTFWMMIGIAHSLILYFLPYLMALESYDILHLGREGGLWVFGNVIYFLATCIVNFMMMLVCLKWSWPLILAVILGPAAWLVIAGVYNALIEVTTWDYFGSVTLMLDDPNLYFTFPFVFFVCCMPYIMYRYYQWNYRADLVSVLLEVYTDFPLLSEHYSTKEVVEHFMGKEKEELSQHRISESYVTPLQRERTRFAAGLGMKAGDFPTENPSSSLSSKI